MRGAAAELALKPAKDGFWVVAPERLRGHTLHYRVSGPAGAQRATVELEPGPEGQFVYTGYHPASVSVEQVLLDGAVSAAAWKTRRRRDDDDDDAAVGAAPAPFRRYPSAY
jgi:hypothetical protein